LAGTAGPKPPPESCRGAGPPGGVSAGEKDVEETVPGRPDPLQPGDRPGNRADVMLVTCQRLFGAGRAVAPILREGRGATLQHQRRGGPITAVVGPATLRALGPAHEGVSPRLPAPHV